MDEQDERPGPGRGDTDSLEDVLVAFESTANRAADVVRAAARAVAGDRLELYHDEDVQTALAVALQAVAAELATLSSRALKRRTGGT